MILLTYFSKDIKVLDFIIQNKDKILNTISRDKPRTLFQVTLQADDYLQIMKL